MVIENGTIRYEFQSAIVIWRSLGLILLTHALLNIVVSNDLEWLVKIFSDRNVPRGLSATAEFLIKGLVGGIVNYIVRRVFPSLVVDFEVLILIARI